MQLLYQEWQINTTGYYARYVTTDLVNVFFHIFTRKAGVKSSLCSRGMDNGIYLRSCLSAVFWRNLDHLNALSITLTRHDGIMSIRPDDQVVGDVLEALVKHMLQRAKGKPYNDSEDRGVEGIRVHRCKHTAWCLPVHRASYHLLSPYCVLFPGNVSPAPWEYVREEKN